MSPGNLGWGLGFLLFTLAVGYAQYLQARQPEKLHEPWKRLAALTGSPRRAASYVLCYGVGWIAAAVIVEKLQLGSLSRDDQISLLLMLLTMAVLALGVFVVWTRAPADRS